MLAEAPAVEAQSPDLPSPASNGSGSAEGSQEDSQQSSTTQTQSQTQKSDSQFPPPKTDKPRPHQKLHFAQGQTRPRNGRRESVSAASTASNSRVRKNSIANSTTGSSAIGFGGQRPRANTLGALDLTSLGLMTRANVLGMNDHRMSVSGVSGLPGAGNMDYRGMSNSMGHHGPIHNLPKLETNGLKQDVEALRTAPAFPGAEHFNFDQMFSTPDNANTINPAQLHFGAGSPISPFPAFGQFENQNPMENMVNDEQQWIQNWTNAQMQNMTNGNDFAVDESSPSHMSNSTNGMGPVDNMMDPNSMHLSMNNLTDMNWVSGDPSNQSLMTPAAFQLGMLQNGLPNLDQSVTSLSPQMLHESPAHDFFNQPYMHNNITNMMQQHQQSVPPASLSNFGSDSPSMSSSMTGSARQSSVTSVSTSSITDATRQALLISLSQPSVFGHNHRKYSQPSISSPLSPGGAVRSGPNLPSTADLQRYVNAYIQYFHPHLPFLHIPTMTFDSADYVNNLRSANMQTSYGHAGIIGGGGCLILAMAAIGALYEYDHLASKELFDSAKRMIQLYLEERRKADMAVAVSSSYGSAGNASHNTPLWLVQAMLLNVIYGHHCGDKQAADIASTHCAALVSLARAAELAQPAATKGSPGNDSHDDGASPNDSHPPQSAGHLAWLKWKDVEERKRTLFAVFILSSLLVTAYNHAPAIMNSEILLDLPCEEDLWASESAGDWLAKGGNQAADSNKLPFAQALTTLLTANQRTPGAFSNNWYTQLQNGNLPRQVGRGLDIRPSTFGCLILINALHNFIWETRSRHHSRQWTIQETESMFAHIEPALNAWQAAWKANEHHHLQRPNPFGLGPLSADSIPLLDLAFVRLFVNLGPSKEAFWNRDFDTMANEFARGAEVMQHGDGSPNDSDLTTVKEGSINSQSRQGLRRPSQVLRTGQGNRRERHLRRAAFYAADSLSISAKFNLTYADASSHELPIQSAMCFFDCGQVLAEWVSSVQERVGRYCGILGREEIDFSQVPAIMLLDAEDVELLNKIENICNLMEEKLIRQAHTFVPDFSSTDPNTGMHGMQQQLEKLPTLREVGYGAKILKVTAYMLEKAAVWPVTHVMSNALEVQAAHIQQRAESSLSTSSVDQTHA
ncbi:fungal specific transcription factor domain-containing protein 23 [Elsinoe australis]|uniref:Fungal specific transcription factor domain-containing protein 23 n=1 Tax=Elsinoe australis TaxID=40998 RepID=A0A4U7B6F6_9PEZI|nr:fungal specific transcription factor domain-containing protein 23 [Elsinoe australis]